MPIFMVGLTAVVIGGAGLVVGGGIGAMVAHLLYLRTVRLREALGAEVRAEEEFSSGCGALLAGTLLGSVLGCGMALGLSYLVVALLAD